MSTKETALNDIITLAQNHDISAKEITKALVHKQSKEDQSKSIISRVLSYLGGIFVFAGICIFIGMQWNDIGSFARVLVTFGSGFVCYIMALTMTTDKYQKASTPLFLMSSFLQPFGLMVMIDEFFNTGGDPINALIFVCCFMLIQQLCTLKIHNHTSLVFTSIFFASSLFVAICDKMGITQELVILTIGATYMLVAYAFTKTQHYLLSPAGYFFGSSFFLFAFFESVERSPFEILFLGLSAFLLYLSTAVKSRILLFNSTCAIILYIGYFTARNFSDSLGWPISLIIIGIVLIGLGGFALKINNKYIKDA